MIELATETQVRFREQMVNDDVLGDRLGYVKFIESFGSDERIIESARMSTDKGFLGWGPKTKMYECPKCGTIPVERSIEIVGGLLHGPCKSEVTLITGPGDEKLLRYLWENKHATPFEMAGMTIEVKAPIMVFREWHRHDKISSIALGRIIRSCEFAFENYNANLEDGVSKEIARLDLPVNTYSKMRASTDLRNWLAFLTLRDDPNAQWEIQQYARVVSSVVEAIFPRTHGLFEEGRALWREFLEWKRAR